MNYKCEEKVPNAEIKFFNSSQSLSLFQIDFNYWFNLNCLWLQDQISFCLKYGNIILFVWSIGILLYLNYENSILLKYQNMIGLNDKVSIRVEVFNSIISSLSVKISVFSKLLPTVEEQHLLQLRIKERYISFDTGTQFLCRQPFGLSKLLLKLKLTLYLITILLNICV